MKYSNAPFIKQISKLSFVKKIILFGSRARGDNTERADIDLAIVCNPNTDSSDWQKVLDIIDDAETLLNIDCIRYDSLAEHSPLRQTIDKEGIILYGSN